MNATAESPAAEQPSQDLIDQTIDQWLADGTAVQVSLDIYKDASLLGELQKWKRHYGRALARHDKEADKERLVGETSELANLEALGEDLLQRLEKSRTTWYFKALPATDESEIATLFPKPEPDFPQFTHPYPERPASATAEQIVEYSAEVQAYLTAHEMYKNMVDRSPEVEKYLYAVGEVQRKRLFERIRRSFVRIEHNGRTVKESLTREQVNALPRSVGEVQLVKISQTISHAAQIDMDATVSPDFLLDSSEDDQDS